MTPSIRVDDPAALRRAYVDEGQSLSAVAEMAGCSYATVRRALLSQGIPIRRSGPPPIPNLRDAEWLRSRTEEGLSADEIAVLLGCAASTVRGALQWAGLNPAADRARPSLLDDQAYLETAYIGENRSVRDIAAEVGATKDAVLLALRRHRVPIRARGRSAASVPQEHNPAGELGTVPDQDGSWSGTGSGSSAARPEAGVPTDPAEPGPDTADDWRSELRNIGDWVSEPLGTGESMPGAGEGLGSESDHTADGESEPFTVSEWEAGAYPPDVVASEPVRAAERSLTRVSIDDWELKPESTAPPVGPQPTRASSPETSGPTSAPVSIPLRSRPEADPVPPMGARATPPPTQLASELQRRQATPRSVTGATLPPVVPTAVEEVDDGPTPLRDVSSRTDAARPTGKLPRERIDLEIDKVQTKTFPVVRRGYDRSEVDAYLRAVAEDYRQVLAKARDAVRAAQAAPTPTHSSQSFDDVGDRVASVLNSAAQAAADIRAAAEEQAEEARRQAEVHIAQAQRVVSDQIAEVERVKAATQDEVDALVTAARAEAARVIGGAQQEAIRIREDAERSADLLERTTRANVDAVLAEARRDYEHLRSAQQQCVDRLASVEYLAREAREGISDGADQLFDAASRAY